MLPRPRQLGAFPQPPSEGVPPPASPLLKPLYWCTLKPTGAVQSLGGDHNLVPYAVHACMAFGFWLATLRHKTATAQAHARQYAGAVVKVARAVLNIPPESFEAAASWLPVQREVAR